MNSIRPLILASNSPRRQDLLKSAGFKFEVFTRDFHEDYPENLNSDDVAEYLARQKNKQYREVLNDEVIITADTTVVHLGEVLNKPIDAAEAFSMLRKLSDSSHEVICGVCVSDSNKTFSFKDVTTVSFLPMSDAEINHYIDTYRPFDKAGAYGIQEWIGLTRISAITGSFYNVMGLPMHKLYDLLIREFQILPAN